MRVSNPLANSYTKNQADSQFVTVDLSGSSSGKTNSINADTLNGKPASDYVLKSEIYPVGSIYMSIDPTDPSTYFGGTWEKIMGRFLLSADDSTYLTGETGGEATHTLTIPEIPSHMHSNAIGDAFMMYVGAGGNIGGDIPGNAIMIGAGTTGPKGGNQPHNNLPPYLVVYMWKRTS